MTTCCFVNLHAYLVHFDPKALAVAVFFPRGPNTCPFLRLNVVLVRLLVVGNLMGTLKDKQEGLPHRGAPRRGSRRSRGAGRWILADLVAHFFGDVAQTLRYRLALPETLDASVQEADPAEQQVRAVTHRHDEGGGGPQLSSSNRRRGRQLTLHLWPAFVFLPWCRDAPVKTDRTEASLNSTHIR